MEPAVVDPGSLLLKAGFAQPDGDPSIVIGTAMTNASAMDESNAKKLSVSEFEETVNPIERGIVKDWDGLEDLWRYVLYTGLGWEVGNEGQLLIAEALLTPKVAREKMVQIMFESFNVAGLYAVEQAVLSLYAMGRITGVAIDVGHGKIDIAPVWEGTVQHNAVKRFELGGQDITLLLAKEIERAHPELRLNLATVQFLKELYGEVAEDQAAYNDSAVDCDPVVHTLPDGQEEGQEVLVGNLTPQEAEETLHAPEGTVVQAVSGIQVANSRENCLNMPISGKVISIGRERLTVGEAFFQPSLLGVEDYSIAEQLLRSVSCCLPPENQRQLVENIVLCGGTSTMSGFEARFQKEAAVLGTPTVRPSLIKPPEYMPENTMRYSAWMGGAILAKVVFPQNQHITKAEYDETGPTIVHRKCY